MTADFCHDVLENLSRLEGFARRLAGNRAFADDLVQETVLRALVHADQFRPGTNLLAWLMTILRNAYLNEKRREQRLRNFDAKAFAMPSSVNADQEWHLEMREVQCRFGALPAPQREALVLVAANGYSYDRAAEIAGCAVGTMKSRVSRARLQLHALLERKPAAPADNDDFASDLAQIA